MSNLSNLHISGSYKGLINLADSTQGLPTQTGDINLQDGLGNNVGIKINASSNNVTIDNNLRVDGNTDLNGNLDVSGSFIHSGSIDIKGNVVIDGNINADVATFDTVNTRLLHVTEESASVIFSSGSNVIGDETSDTQTIVGQTTISGALDLLDGTNLRVIDGDISSSTVSGIGNVTTYSASVDSKISSLINRTGSVDTSITALNSFTSSQLSINSRYNSFTSSINTFTSSTDSSLTAINSFTSSTDSSLTAINSFTQSADNRLNSLENFTSSIAVTKTEFNSYTSSTDNRLDSIESFTASLQTDFVTTGSFNTYTQSTDNHLTQLDLYTASNDNRLTQIEITTASLDSKVDNLISVTGSYATTGSNTFIGDQVFSGSVQGDVHALTISSNTASIDCSQGNFFTLNQSSAADTHLVATNITGGRTITLRVNKTNSGATVSIDNNTIKFPSGFEYSITPGATAQDVVTFVTFDTTSLYAVASKNFV